MRKTIIKTAVTILILMSFTQSTFAQNVSIEWRRVTGDFVPRELTVADTNLGEPAPAPGNTTTSYVPPNNVVGSWRYFAVVRDLNCGTITFSDLTAVHTTTAPPPAGCNTNELTFSLGMQSFSTNQTWIVGSQEWSDAVRMSGCNKTSYSNGPNNNFNADCRNATNGFDGHYFSWCMVARFADTLCPGDWRVPSTEDFAELHRNLGFSMPSTLHVSVPMIANTYMGTSGTGGVRGGIWGGARWTVHAADLTGQASMYWSSSQNTGSQAFRLRFTSTEVFPQGNNFKSGGHAVRCVRNP
jgi:uncharacterized protein (TIGR02145 family)